MNWELVPGQKYAGFERTSSTITGNSKETFDFYTVVKARFIKLICYVCGWSHGHTPQTRWMNIQEFDIYHMEYWDEKYNKYEITDAVQKYYFFSEGGYFSGNFDHFTNYYAIGANEDASKGRFNSLREICNNSTSKPLNTIGYPFISLDKSFEIRDLKHTANFDFEKPIYSKDEILISDSINELLAGNLKKSLQNAGVQSKGPTWYSFSNIDGSLNSNNCVLGSSTQTHGIIGHFGSSDNNWIKSTLTSMHRSNGCNNWSDLLCISEKK